MVALKKMAKYSMQHNAMIESDTETDFEASTMSPHTKMLASRLSGHMGIEGAIKISEENQWHGVLAVLRSMQAKRP